ncbi:MAG: ACT domain-containing protein [Oscillospiraceae bacterium]|nr:ACT domain-containing protein [Oscillospiraceae bacterium]
MNLKLLPFDLSVCKLQSHTDISFNLDFCFIAKTDEEISLVCKTEDVPLGVICRDDGWCGFYFDETLDFSLIGILSKISTILAENKIGIFAVSTFNTDYILVKSENFDKAVAVLESSGYTFTENK